MKGGMVVCEKHFLPDDIIWRREVKDSGGNVAMHRYVYADTF